MMIASLLTKFIAELKGPSSTVGHGHNTSVLQYEVQLYRNAGYNCSSIAYDGDYMILEYVHGYCSTIDYCTGIYKMYDPSRVDPYSYRCSPCLTYVEVAVNQT